MAVQSAWWLGILVMFVGLLTGVFGMAAMVYVARVVRESRRRGEHLPDQLTRVFLWRCPYPDVPSIFESYEVFCRLGWVWGVGFAILYLASVVFG